MKFSWLPLHSTPNTSKSGCPRVKLALFMMRMAILSWPFSSAKTNGNLPLLSLTLTSALLFSKISTMLSRPEIIINQSVVHFQVVEILSFNSENGKALDQLYTIPFRAAKWSGVNPSSSLTLRSIPFSIDFLINSSFP